MKGKIDTTKLNTSPERHELETAKYFAELGYDIVFIPTSNIPNMHTPDIKMAGHEWEIKSPQGNGKNTIEHIFKKAVTQSHYIIFDLRRIQLPENKCISQLKNLFDSRSYVKIIHIIKKNNELITLSRK